MLSSSMQKYDNTEMQYEVGDWVIVHYADKYSKDDQPGDVTQVAENEVAVSVMHRSCDQEYSLGAGRLGGYPSTWTCFPPSIEMLFWGVKRGDSTFLPILTRSLSRKNIFPTTFHNNHKILFPWNLNIPYSIYHLMHLVT